MSEKKFEVHIEEIIFLMSFMITIYCFQNNIMFVFWCFLVKSIGDFWCVIKASWEYAQEEIKQNKKGRAA